MQLLIYRKRESVRERLKEQRILLSRFIFLHKTESNINLSLLDSPPLQWLHSSHAGQHKAFPAKTERRIGKGTIIRGMWEWQKENKSEGETSNWDVTNEKLAYMYIDRVTDRLWIGKKCAVHVYLDLTSCDHDKSQTNDDR